VLDVYERFAAAMVKDANKLKNSGFSIDSSPQVSLTQDLLQFFNVDGIATAGVSSRISDVFDDRTRRVVLDVAVDTRTKKDLLLLLNRIHHTDPKGPVFECFPLGACGDTRLASSTLHTAAPRLEELHNLILENGYHYLVGQYAAIKDIEFPNEVISTGIRGDLQAAADTFLFHASNAYYHIDKAQQYLFSLGFRGACERQVMIDAAAISSTTPDAQYINDPVGKGAVFFSDTRPGAAADPDVVVHEHGHVVQACQCGSLFDFGKEARAMAEGFADYWAMTVLFDESEPSCRPCHASWLFEGKCQRRLDTNLKMSDFATLNDEHERGRIWSRALSDIRANLGPRIADWLILQAHMNLGQFGSSPDMREGAEAILAAVTQQTSAIDQRALIGVFCDRGIMPTSECTVPPLACPIH
jgi:hypothetical protein